MSRKVKYLTDKEALQLGLRLNKKQGNRTKARYRLSNKQWSVVYENRIELKDGIDKDNDALNDLLDDLDINLS